LSFDIYRFRIFSNTLQAIAIGYLVASLLFLFFKTKWQIVVASLLLIAYWAVFYYFGDNDFSPIGNIAYRIDNVVLGRFKDGVFWKNGEWFFSDSYTYTWILSSLNFSATILLGTFAGSLLKTSISENKKTLLLGVIGAVLLIIGFVWSSQMPIIKRLWTSSMTLFSGGICFLLLAVFYYVIDVRKIQKPFLWLRIYGMNSIVAYVLFELVNFRSVGTSLFYGLEQFSVNLYPFFIELSQVGCVFGVLFFMYRRNYFVKI
jgi:predicted acyltransferase